VKLCKLECTEHVLIYICICALYSLVAASTPTFVVTSFSNSVFPNNSPNNKFKSGTNSGSEYILLKTKLPTQQNEVEASTMVTVHLEMEPFSGPIDLSKTAVIIIDMQVRIE
jgi:hypothetical protein